MDLPEASRNVAGGGQNSLRGAQNEATTCAPTAGKPACRMRMETGMGHTTMRHPLLWAPAGCELQRLSILCTIDESADAA